MNRCPGPEPERPGTAPGQGRGVSAGTTSRLRRFEGDSGRRTAGRKSQTLGHQEVRPALDLVVDPANILADNAERDELHSSHKEHRNEDGGPAGYPALGKEPHHQGISYSEQRDG